MELTRGQIAEIIDEFSQEDNVVVTDLDSKHAKEFNEGLKEITKEYPEFDPINAGYEGEPTDMLLELAMNVAEDIGKSLGIDENMLGSNQRAKQQFSDWAKAFNVEKMSRLQSVINQEEHGVGMVEDVWYDQEKPRTVCVSYNNEDRQCKELYKFRHKSFMAYMDGMINDVRPVHSEMLYDQR